MENEEGYYVSCSIRGGYNETQTRFMALDEETTFTFDFVPVGYRVYAEINAYRTLPEPQDYRGEILVYTGKSDAIKVNAGENYLAIDTLNLDSNRNRIGLIQGSNDEPVNYFV